MKKFFTLIAAVALAASVNAQTTLIDYPTSQSGITLHNVGGQISFATVKIHTNKDEVPCIKIGKSFSAENLVVDNFVELTTASFVAYLILGFTNANIWIMLVVALALLIVFYLLSCRLWGVKAAESK